MSTLYALGIFILILSPLVFFHELGHYMMARWFGVKVEVFSIGFGPALYQWKAKSGTVWKFSAIPLGGYVKMAGDEDIASAKQIKKNTPNKNTLTEKSSWQRILVALAGPLANYLVAGVLLVTLFSLYGVGQYSPKVRVKENSVAWNCGMRTGDVIKTLHEQEVTHTSDVIKVMQKWAAQPPQDPDTNTSKEETLKDAPVLSLDVQRTPHEGLTGNKEAGNDDKDGAMQHFLRIDIPVDVKKPLPRLVSLGISFGASDPISFKALSMGQALSETWNMLNPIETLKKFRLDSVGGPINLVQRSGDMAGLNIYSIILFIAMISAGLGFFNLLPVPLLDGGAVLMVIIEAIVRRPLPEKVQEIILWISAGGLGVFFLFVSYRDILRIETVQRWLSCLGITLGA